MVKWHPGKQCEKIVLLVAESFQDDIGTDGKGGKEGGNKQQVTETKRVEDMFKG